MTGAKTQDEIKKVLDEALRPFLFLPVTEEFAERTKDAMVEAFFSLTGKTPYIEVDSSEMWKNEISFGVSWSGGRSLRITLGPDDL